MDEYLNVVGGSKQANLVDWSICAEQNWTQNKGNLDCCTEDFFHCARTVSCIDVVVCIPNVSQKMTYWLTRANYGIMLQIEGKMKYFYDSKEFIVSQGDIMLFPKGKKYRGVALSPQSKRICVNFQINENVFCEPSVYKFEDTKKFYPLFEKINSEWLKAENPFRCMELLYEIMSCIYVKYHSPYTSPKRKDRFSIAKNYIDKHFTDQDLSVKTVSEAVGISEVYIRKLFSSFSMMSPLEYIRLLRIRYAQNLLETGQLNISEVAEAVGYKETSYFCKQFKAVTGKTPRDFRNFCGATTIEKINEEWEDL